jgi:hypothetical protein
MCGLLISIMRFQEEQLQFGSSLDDSSHWSGNYFVVQLANNLTHDGGIRIAPKPGSIITSSPLASFVKK